MDTPDEYLPLMREMIAQENAREHRRAARESKAACARLRAVAAAWAEAAHEGELKKAITVARLVEILSALPQDQKVLVNDDGTTYALDEGGIVAQLGFVEIRAWA